MLTGWKYDNSVLVKETLRFDWINWIELLHPALHLQHLIRSNRTLIVLASQEIQTDMLELDDNSILMKRTFHCFFHVFVEASATLFFINLLEHDSSFASMQTLFQQSRDGNLHGSGMSHATIASPKRSIRASWRMGDAVVGRENAGWAKSKNGHISLCQNWSQGPPVEKTGRGTLLNRPSCHPDDTVGEGVELNWNTSLFGCPVLYPVLYCIGLTSSVRPAYSGFYQ